MRKRKFKQFRQTSRKELWYLEDDNGDDCHLWAEPREETLQLTTLTNQVTINNNGNQAHGFHCSLEEEKNCCFTYFELQSEPMNHFNLAQFSLSQLVS